MEITETKKLRLWQATKHRLNEAVKTSVSAITTKLKTEDTLEYSEDGEPRDDESILNSGKYSLSLSLSLSLSRSLSLYLLTYIIGESPAPSAPAKDHWDPTGHYRERLDTIGAAIKTTVIRYLQTANL